MIRSILILACVVSFLTTKGDAAIALNNNDNNVQWSNSWSVEIHGGSAKADAIAKKHGFVNLGQVGSLENKYTFVRMDNEVFIGSSPIHLSSVEYDVTSFMADSDIKQAVRQKLRTLVKRFSPPTASNDPIWEYQWNVNNTGQTNEPNLFLDINIIGAWIQGYTGEGLVVGVVDDGVQGSHRDLNRNYNYDDSYDYFDDDDNADPSIVDDYHGTACAGEIAMVRSNDRCGVGAAYDSQIAGIRLLGDSLVADSQEGSSLSHKRNQIQIYSNSWGPSDDGTTTMGPGPLVDQAFMEGSDLGRDGLGNVFVWAAGNGGYNFDSCAADGYVQSIYTIPVGAYNQMGGPAIYDERCSAKMTVAFVENNNDRDLLVPSILTNNRCTLDFSGTSSAAPLVSAVVALSLEANSQLTWRDIQYLIVYTSNSDLLLTNTFDEFVNGAGLTVSHHFGFGAIDGEAMVTRAQQWINVPPQMNEAVAPSVDSGTATFGNPLVSQFTYNGNIQYLEHVVITVTLNVSGYNEAIDQAQAQHMVDQYTNGVTTRNETAFDSYIKRGDFEVTITSPSGTTSTLLYARPYDIVSTEGYYEWPFLTVLHWGENPNGQWNVNVTWTNSNGGEGIVEGLSATFYGVSEVPEAVANIPETCSSMCARTKGCSGPDPIDCDVCRSDRVRNASSLECIEPIDCVEPYTMSDGYCYIPSAASSTLHCSITGLSSIVLLLGLLHSLLV